MYIHIHIFIYVIATRDPLGSHPGTPGRHSGGPREAQTIATRETLWRHCGPSSPGPGDTDHNRSENARETPRATDPGPRKLCPEPLGQHSGHARATPAGDTRGTLGRHSGDTLETFLSMPHSGS